MNKSGNIIVIQGVIISFIVIASLIFVGLAYGDVVLNSDLAKDLITKNITTIIDNESITFEGQTTISSFTVLNQTWLDTDGDNDVIEIDTQLFTCTLNSVAVDYDGIFPSFVVGGNDLRVSFEDGVHYKAVVKIWYYPLYLWEIIYGW